FDRLTRLQYLDVYRESRLKQFLAKSHFESLDHSIKPTWTHHQERLASLNTHSDSKRRQQRPQLANVIDMKMTNKQMTHPLPRQIVFSKRVHAAGAAVQHHRCIRKLQKVPG